MNNEILLTLVGTAVAVFAICNINNKSVTNEGFAGMASMKAVPLGPIGYHGPDAQTVAVARPNYQGSLSPRFNNAHMKGPVAHNPASIEHQAVPQNPLTYAQQIGGVKDTVTFQGSSQPLEKFQHGAKLPMGDMTSNNQPIDKVVQPLVYDRLIFANRSSRLRSGGDPIRGDLYIKPMSGNWFVPSVNPSVDLQQGALNVIAGVSNEQGKSISQGIYDSSGHTEAAIAGVPVKNRVNVTAFPK